MRRDRPQRRPLPLAPPARRTDGPEDLPCRPAARRPASRWRSACLRPSPPESRLPTGRRRGIPAPRRAYSTGSVAREAVEPADRSSAWGTPAMKEVRVGCSGWMYDDWRGRLYPEREPKRRWLELYAGRFDTVEVNSTFYRLARRDAVAAWVEQTPPGFLVAVKASRYLTHIKRLAGIR